LHSCRDLPLNLHPVRSENFIRHLIRAARKNRGIIHVIIDILYALETFARDLLKSRRRGYFGETNPNRDAIESLESKGGMAQSGSAANSVECPLSGVKRISKLMVITSGFDPKRTWHRLRRQCGGITAQKLKADRELTLSADLKPELSAPRVELN